MRVLNLTLCLALAGLAEVCQTSAAQRDCRMRSAGAGGDLDCGQSAPRRVPPEHEGDVFTLSD